MMVSKKVAKFNDMQADSLMRKAIGKKDINKFNLTRQMFIWGKKNCIPPKNYDKNNVNQVYYDPNMEYGDEILGGVNNGYTEKELIEFFDSIREFARYAFNRSHR